MVNSGESVSSTKSPERDKKHGVGIYLLKVILDGVNISVIYFFSQQGSLEIHIVTLDKKESFIF